MWKSLVRMSDEEHRIVPMCVIDAWEPSSNWTEVFLCIREYEEKNEREGHIWLEAPKSII